MSAKNNKKESASDALLRIDMIKEASNENLKNLLAETVQNYLNEAICKEEEDKDDDKAEKNDKDDKDYSIEDNGKSDKAEDDEKDSNESEQNEWAELDKYKVGDDEYDVTGIGEDDEDILVKLKAILKDSDELAIVDDSDEPKIKDNESGAEYILVPDEDGENAETDSDDEFEIDLDDDGDEDEHEDEEPTFELDLDGEDEENNDNDEEDSMKESKERIFEIDLGYTDNYQDKDPIKGLSNAEPSKSGRSWDAGLPKGTEKPWAGKGSSKPYGCSTSCCEGEKPEDDAPLTEEDLLMDDAPIEENVTMPARRKKHKAIVPQGKENPKAAHHISKNGEYKGAIEEELKKLQKENREMKAIIPAMKKAMNESALVNYKFARIANLFMENSTTKKEKVDIVNRFVNEAKTFKETNALYESIKRELSSAKTTPVLESKVQSAEKSTMNESTIYKSPEIANMLGLIQRMDNCYKK